MNPSHTHTQVTKSLLTLLSPCRAQRDHPAHGIRRRDLNPPAPLCPHPCSPPHPSPGRARRSSSRSSRKSKVADYPPYPTYPTSHHPHPILCLSSPGPLTHEHVHCARGLRQLARRAHGADVGGQNGLQGARRGGARGCAGRVPGRAQGRVPAGGARDRARGASPSNLKPATAPQPPPPQLPTPRPFPPPTLDPSLFFQIDHSVHTFSGALAFEPHARDPPHARSRRPHPSPPPLSLSSVGGRVLQRAPPAARQTPLPRPTRSQLTTHARRLVCPWQFLSH